MRETISRRDIDFQLHEVLDIARLCGRDYFAEHDPEVFGPMLDTAEEIAREQFLACNADGDQHMAEIVDGVVRTVPAAKTALAALFEAGFAAATLDSEVDGLQLPVTLSNACMAMFQSANIGLCGPVLLTVGVANLINAFGSGEQKQAFLPGLLSGSYFGTMCLSEPHAGSSLTDIRTRAEPQDDGSYRITGTKMWITGGEHELSDNIIHMVLA
ncbi:MAG: acyl-CoA dehydrogenase, partial [Gammaproteobacteria bacterium]|nr:acyl-CoA dehydrogenase [Gammaproteobacteria bacterium]